MRPSSRSRSRRAGAPLLAWTVLLVCVVVIMAIQRFVAPEPGPVVEVGPDMDQVFTGRLIVGLHHLGQQAAAGTGQTTTQQLFNEFVATAYRPVDQLRVAAVEAELHGAEPARDRVVTLLDELAEARPDPAADADAEAVVNELSTELVYQDAQLLLAIYAGALADEPAMAIADDERAQLLVRHGWFGRLALSHDPGTLEAAPAFRRAVVQEATRTVLLAAGVVVGLVVAGLVGLGLLILALVLWADGRLRWRYRPTRRPTGPYLEAAAVFLLLMLVLSVALGLGEAVTGVPMTGLLYVLVPLAIFWPLLRGVSWTGWCEAFGWRRGAGVWREVGSGLVGYLAGLPIIALGLVLTVLLSALLMEEPEHPVAEELFAGGLVELLLVLALAVVWAPVVEEAIFRGAFYHHMRRRWNALLSGLVVGLVFAAIHPQGLVGIPVLTAVAVVMSMIREWRGSLIGPITAHAVHNFGATMILLLVMR